MNYLVSYAKLLKLWKHVSVLRNNPKRVDALALAHSAQARRMQVRSLGFPKEYFRRKVELSPCQQDVKKGCVCDWPGKPRTETNRTTKNRSISTYWFHLPLACLADFLIHSQVWFATTSRALRWRAAPSSSTSLVMVSGLALHVLPISFETRYDKPHLCRKKHYIEECHVCAAVLFNLTISYC